MPVVVDTNVWSLALRRRRKDLSARERAVVIELRELIVADEVVLPGVVRQELLSGMRTAEAFDETRHYLAAFDDIAPEIADYERAAEYSNRCRDAGIAGSAADMLICSLADGRGLPILTTDADFRRYSRHLPITLSPLP